MELTSEKSVTSDELCIAGGRTTTIEDETNTIYSSIASCGQMTKDQSIEETQPTSNGLLHLTREVFMTVIKNLDKGNSC